VSEPLPVQPALSPASALGADPVRRRLVAAGEVLLCSSVPTQIGIGAVLRAAGMAPTDAAGNLSLAFVLTLSLADTVVLIGLMVALTRAHGEAPSELWVGSARPWREMVHGLLTVPVVAIAAGVMLNAIRLFAPSLHNVPSNPLEQLAATPGEAALLALTAIVAGGVREELQRAFLLRRFEQHLGGATVGVIVLSVAFGLGHYVQGWDAVIVTGTLGAVWAGMYLKRRSSIAPLVSHAGFNSLEILRVAVGSV
jgi:membrane protease YdiL (CAAX protease family)